MALSNIRYISSVGVYIKCQVHVCKVSTRFSVGVYVMSGMCQMSGTCVYSVDAGYVLSFGVCIERWVCVYVDSGYEHNGCVYCQGMYQMSAMCL